MLQTVRRAVVDRAGKPPCGIRLLTSSSAPISLHSFILSGVKPSSFTKKMSGFNSLISLLKSNGNSGLSLSEAQKRQAIIDVNAYYDELEEEAREKDAENAEESKKKENAAIKALNDKKLLM